MTQTHEDTPPPADLEPEGRELWRATRAALIEQGTWADSDGQVLALYVSACERARRARAESGGAITAEGSQGQLVPHPAAKIASAAESEALRCATALLLTAEARRRQATK
ncbi:MAG: P27 family phage terminase small subunit [Solirubrobacteraceae bacterium]